MMDSTNNPSRSQVKQLPYEIFKKIFSYVDYRKDIALACLTFHQIACELEKNRFPLHLSCFQIYDDDIYDSLINTQRHFCHIIIDLKNNFDLSSFTRFGRIIKKFGRHIKILKIWSSNPELTANMSEVHLVNYLQIIPNIEELILCNLLISADQNTKLSNDLNLRQLKILFLNECYFDTSLILDHIPINVLQDLVFTYDRRNDKLSIQNFFNRQSKITKLEMREAIEGMGFRNLTIYPNMDLVLILTRLPEIRQIDLVSLGWIGDAEFIAMCNLKYLEVLRTYIGGIDQNNIKLLKKLTMLKELRLDSDYQFDQLASLKGMQLEKLILVKTGHSISEEVLINISRNFLNIKHIEISSESLNNINTVIENFPNIESAMFAYSTFCLVVRYLEFDLINWRHENLTQLVISHTHIANGENTVVLLKLLNTCTNLQKLLLSHLKNISSERLKEIIDNHPRLTHLSLEIEAFKFDLDMVKITKNLTKHLMHLRLIGAIEYPSNEALFNEFGENFSDISFQQNSNGEGILVVKKRKMEDWYSNLNLKDPYACFI